MTMSYETRAQVSAALDEMRREMGDLDRRVSDLERMAVSIHNAAKVTGLRDRDLRRAISEGDLPAMRIGGRVVIFTSDLRNWVESHKLAPLDREAS